MELNVFNTENLFNATNKLFAQLGIQLNSQTAMSLQTKDLLADNYLESFDKQDFPEIQELYFAGIIDKSIFETDMFKNGYTIDDAKDIDKNAKNYAGFMIFALQLDKHPTRTQIADLSRAFNRKWNVPAALLLKYSNLISLALPEKFKYLQNWRQGEKVGKVIILRNINIDKPHAGHLRILDDLAKHNATDFNELHEKWLEILDVNILNKKFYAELSNWYFWAIQNVKFPDDIEKNEEIRNSTNLIRLITRVIFIWFIKEKGLIPENLFDKHQLESILKDFSQKENYYNAILQNLFFGTLNQTMDNRGFITDKNFQDNITNLYRYLELFKIKENEAVALLKDVPFLNGGLFDCLDKTNENGETVYIDGFSINSKNRAIVPDFLFFGTEREVD